MARAVNPVPQELDDAGEPLVRAKLYTYESGTDTLKTTYSDANQTKKNANPLILTGSGRWPNIFFTGIAKQKLTSSDDVQIWERDPVGDSNPNDSISNWSSVITYNINDLVQGSDGAFYKSITDGNTNNDPTTSAAFWEEFKLLTVWNTNVTYDLSDIVIGSDGLMYRSLIGSNSGNDPISSPSEWGPTTSPVGTADIQDGSVTLAKLNEDAYINRNLLINGDMAIDQRGGPYTATGYTLDRFYSDLQTGDSGAGTVTQEAFTVGQTDVPGAQFYLQHIQSSGTATLEPGTEQRIENVESHSNENITYTIWARVTSGTEDITPKVVQNFGSGGSTAVGSSGATMALTTTWQEFDVTFAVPSVSGKTIGAGSYLSLGVFYPAASTYTIQTTFWKSEFGIVSTQFIRAGQSIGGDLELAQRYYFETDDFGMVQTTAEGRFANNLIFPTTMRAIPTLTTPDANSGNMGNTTVTGCRQSGNATINGGYLVQADAEL